MNKSFAVIALLMMILESLFTTAIAEKPEVAYTYNPNVDERIPLFFEPAQSATLFGEYSNGVKVNVLEHVSDEWVKVQIVTREGIEGVQMYMEDKYLVYGEEGEKVEKTTVIYVTSSDDTYLAAAAHGQSTYYGPYDKGERLELLGIIVDSGNKYNDRPLTLDRNRRLHFKIGETTGFVNSLEMNHIEIADKELEEKRGLSHRNNPIPIQSIDENSKTVRKDL